MINFQSTSDNVRVLVDISHALWECAGIPQVARQMTSIFSRSEDVDVSALILSIHGMTGADRFRGKSDPSQSLVEDAEFLADALGQHPKPRRGLLRLAHASLSKLNGAAYPLIQIRKHIYDDLIWENYFAPGLAASHRTLLTGTTFYRTPLTRREITRRLRRLQPPPCLDTSNFEFIIFQNPTPVSVSPSSIKIIRCHDLVPVLRFDTQPSERYLIRDFHGAVSRCIEDGSYFACVSKSTREELVSFYPEAAGRSFVIPNSIAFPTSETRPLPSENDDYFLAVGTIEPRKNYCRLLHGFRAFRLTQPNPPRLVLVGFPGWRNEKELREIDLAVKEGWLTWHKGLPQEQLVDLYTGACALICASVHEGFGIPPIEAASLGTPAALANLPVFHDHFGDAAEYFDPYDSASIPQALARLTPERREQIRMEAMQKVRRFQSDEELSHWRELFHKLKHDKKNGA